MRGNEKAPRLGATVRFFPTFCGVLVEVEAAGLPRDGFFALHIHEGGVCSGEGFSETGGHYSKNDAAHPYHSGDLPPLLSCGGKAFMQVCTDRFTVDEIIGRTVVIHGGVDDFTSQPAGNAGEKIACGVIQRTGMR